MFQNISDEIEDNEIENEVKEKNSKLRPILKNIIKPQNILLYIVSGLISSVSIMNGLAPFGLAIFSASCSAGLVAFPIFIATLIGTGIGFGKDVLLNYLLTSFIFLILMMLVRPKKQGDQNEKRKLGVHLMSAVFLVQSLQIFTLSFMVSDVLETLLRCVVIYIFYKIFVNSIPVIKQMGTTKVFTAEEAIGASLILAIAICALGSLSIFGFSVRNILCILLVLMLGWKNGILIGTTTGVTLSVILNLIGFGEPALIAIYAVSGLITGILGKIGKIGVAIGIALGFTAIYFLNEAWYINYLKEILIASVGLLIMPRNMAINIEDIIGKTKLLPVTRDNRLEENKEAIYKLDSMSKSIEEMAKSYDEAAATVVEEENLELFKENLKISLEDIQNNMLYEDLIDMENGIVDDIFDILLQKEEIENEDLIKIFENHNSFIIGIEDKEAQRQIEKQIYQAVKIINSTYQISKMDAVWKKKVSGNNKIVSEQLNTVSKAINNMAKEMKKGKKTKSKEEQETINILQKHIDLRPIDIEKHKNGKYTIKIERDNNKDDTLKTEKILSKVLNDNIKWKLTDENIDIYESSDKYKLSIGISRTTKNKSEVSGDSSTQMKLKDGKYLLAISDGMGSGEKARKSSKTAINMLESLLSSGFDKKTSVELINSALNTNIEDDMYATLDICVLDLYTGNAEFVKTGACPTYIKNKEEVRTLKETAMPAGMLTNIELTTYDTDIENGDIIVMCSDGIIESAGQNKESWLKEILGELSTDNVQKIADIIIREAIDNSLGIAKDDMTILVAKVELN